MLLFGALVPHAAIIIREMGVRRPTRFLQDRRSHAEAAGIFKDLSPETVVVFSPHGPVMERQLPVRGEESLEGNLRQFGSRLSWTFQTTGNWWT